MEKKPRAKLPPRAQQAADISRRLHRWARKKKPSTSDASMLDDRLQEGGRYLDPVFPPIKTITIMADFGGAYAWLKGATREGEEVGPNIADAVSGLGEEYGAPPELEKQFAAWVIRFERGCRNPAFDWNAFHREGVALSQNLKQVLGEAYRVVYVKPREDPNYGTNRRTEI